MVQTQAFVPVEVETPVSRTAKQASPRAVIGAFALVILGGIGAWAVWDTAGSAIRPEDASTTFLTLFVFAVAIERVLEPFSRWLPGAAAAAGGGPAAVARGKADRAVVAWGLASALASVVSSASGFYLLHAIAGPGWNGVAAWIDAVITGLMIGGGTKPLHDLITRMQYTV